MTVAFFLITAFALTLAGLLTDNVFLLAFGLMCLGLGLHEMAKEDDHV